MKRIVLITLTAVVFLSSCGANVYRATIQGFVRDTITDAGINDAFVRIYDRQPETATDEGFFALTSTVTQGGNAGFFSSAVLWRSVFSRFGAEASTGEIWLGITHPDYADIVVQAVGILSDETNSLATTFMESTSFRVDEVRGQVVDTNGDGVNGVRIVLDFLATDDPEDEVVLTETDETSGEDGVFTFADLVWTDDEAAGQDSDDEDVVIGIVDDDEWESTEQISATLTSGQDRDFGSNPINATRQARTDFNATVLGVAYSYYDGDGAGGGSPDEPDVPAVGLEVLLSFTDGDGTVIEQLQQTAADGSFQFAIDWTDSTPGNFDDGAADSSAVDSQIPDGEDGLLVDITYDPNGTWTPNPFDPTGLDITGFRVKSWITPNRLPEARFDAD